MNNSKDPESNQVDGDELPDLLGKGYRLLKFGGIHPRRLIGLRMITLVVTGVLYVTPYVISSVFSIYEAMNIDGNVVDLMENLQLPAGYTQVIGKLLTTFFQRQRLEFLISDKHKFWNLEGIKDLRLRKEIKQMCNTCLNIQTAVITLATITMIFTDLSPFLISNKAVPLGTMNSVESELWININLVSQEVGFFLCIPPVSALDVIFTGVCFKIAVQFKILNYTFKNIDFNGDCKRLVEAVKYQCFLLEYANTFKQAFQFMLLTMFLSAFVILGQHMFSFNASEDIDFGAVGRFFVILGQCGFFCYIAQLLSAEIEGISDAMYHSAWYENLSPTNRSVVLMVMARSLKPPKLSAYGLIDINIDTLGKIVKAAFSMYSLLSNIK